MRLIIMKCQTCDKELPREAKFCPYCGREVVLTVAQRLTKLESQVFEVLQRVEDITQKKDTKVIVHETKESTRKWRFRSKKERKEHEKLLKQVIKYAEDNKMSIKKAHKKLTGRDVIARDYTTISKLKQEMHRPREGDYSKNRKRALFMQSRARQLVKQDTQLTYAAALSRAAQEWNHHGKVQHVKAKPQILQIDAANNRLLELIEHAHNNTKRITMRDCELIGVRDKLQWEDLLKKVAMQSHAIASYLNMTNNIKIVALEGNIYELEV